MNIYNDSSAYITQSNSSNGNFTNLTAQNAIIQNAAIDNLNVDQAAVFNSIDTNNLTINGFNNGDILFSQNSGVIDGLQIGTNNDVLCSNGSGPEWRNDLVINDLTTNTLKIPGTAQGDLIVMNSSQQATRLLIGSSGKFLISDGINPQWEPLPNPLIIGSAQINGTLELTSYTNKTLITDNTGFIISENIQYNNGSSIINTTPSQIYSNLTWNFTNNSWYSIKVQINNGLQSIIGLVKINTTIIGYVNCLASNTWYCEFTYNHTGPTGLNAMVLTDFNTPAGSSNITYSIKVERTPIPTFVL